MYETINIPINYDGLELKNRIIFAPTTFGLAEDEYFEKIRKIAAGGCAMVIIGDVPVGKSQFEKSLFDKKGFAHYQKLVEIVHSYDCRICAQLHQTDSNMLAMLKYVPGVLTKKISMEELRPLLNAEVAPYISKLSTRKIHKIINGFGEAAVLDDFLQKGSEMVAAGYIIYGSSTMLVYTVGRGVNGFTLDPSLGEFCLSHPNIKTPASGKIYSINEGNYEKFPVGIKKYIKYCQEKDAKTNRPYTSRYIGSLVADFHRNMLKGGVFMYPSTDSHPNGKLRLLYECNPIAFIAEQAGGLAFSEEGRILDLQPEAIHQRVTFYAGAHDMVMKVKEFLNFFNNI